MRRAMHRTGGAVFALLAISRQQLETILHAPAASPGRHSRRLQVSVATRARLGLCSLRAAKAIALHALAAATSRGQEVTIAAAAALACSKIQRVAPDARHANLSVALAGSTSAVGLLCPVHAKAVLQASTRRLLVRMVALIASVAKPARAPV